MTQQDVNLYYRLNAQSVPEAFPDFYQGSLVEGGGCKALHVSLSALAHRLPPLWTTCCLHESLQLHQFCACLKPAQNAMVEGGGCKALHVSLSALAHRLPPLWTTCCLHESLHLHQFCACLKPAQNAMVEGGGCKALHVRQPGL